MNRSLYVRSALWLLAWCLLLGVPGFVFAQVQAVSTDGTAPAVSTAPIVIDGEYLFSLRGATSYPADVRAEAVRERVINAARDASIAPESVAVVDQPDRTQIVAGETVLFAVFDADSELEGVTRQQAAALYQRIISAAITQYRTDRSPEVLLRHSGFALGATLVMALILWGTVLLNRWVNSLAERHIQTRFETLEHKSHHLIRAQQAWQFIAGGLRVLRFLLLATVIYFYLNTVLGLYPWTRPASLILFDLVLNPLESLGRGFLGAIPNLAFLLILFLVVRYFIKLTRLFFDGITAGRIKLRNFDPDWALPTYKIARVLIVAFSLVIAYPYIPGSDSGAFKGVSLFIGVIFSLGSSSFIANIMAGFSMTYRGAFKVGDRVKIGDVAGAVEDVKLMITRIRTPKNEIVVIPNSNILNTNVVNFSVLAREQGLLLHTTVGIGYEVSWRQVEAMLLIAADRTAGLKKDPKPFVLQLSLGDFAVVYEINAYCDDASRMLALYSALHANIQDVFNEHGIQIMTPAYEGDPETAKVVPPAEWYTAPAIKPQP